MLKNALLFLLLWGTQSHDPSLHPTFPDTPTTVEIALPASAAGACESSAAGCFYRFCPPYTSGSGCIQCPGKTSCCKKKIAPKPKPPIS